MVPLLLALPFAILFFVNRKPNYGEHVPSVHWLPDSASDICFYKSKQLEVYEFNIDPREFRNWAQSRGMSLRRLSGSEVVSRYKAYLPADDGSNRPTCRHPMVPLILNQFNAWQRAISIKIESGLIAKAPDESIAVYDAKAQRAYYEGTLPVLIRRYKSGAPGQPIPVLSKHH